MLRFAQHDVGHLFRTSAGLYFAGYGMVGYSETRGGKPVMLPAIYVTEIDAPDIELSWKRRAFAAPDGRWSVVYHSPCERHTGEMGWQISLIETVTGVDRTPDALRGLSSGDGLLCTTDLRPWRFDGQVMVLLPWSGSPKLLDVTSGEITPCEATGTPLTVQWAATVPYLLCVYFDHISVLDGTGRLVSTVNWEPDESEIPYTGWTQDDTHFFLLRHPRKKATPQLVFFDPGHAPAMAGSIDLDPVRLVPYDAGAYEELQRDRRSLIVEGGQRAAGVLLDTWHQIRWDVTGSRLLLSIYRPVGLPARPGPDGEWACAAEERWLAIHLARK